MLREHAISRECRVFGEVSPLKLQQAGSGKSSELGEMTGQGCGRSWRGEGQGQGSVHWRMPLVFPPEGLVS